MCWDRGWDYHYCPLLFSWVFDKRLQLNSLKHCYTYKITNITLNIILNATPPPYTPSAGHHGLKQASCDAIIKVTPRHLLIKLPLPVPLIRFLESAPAHIPCLIVTLMPRSIATPPSDPTSHCSPKSNSLTPWLEWCKAQTRTHITRYSFSGGHYWQKLITHHYHFNF